MQAHLLVGPIPTTKINGSDSFSSFFTRQRQSRRPLVVTAASSSAINGEQDHYKVLGIARNATSADVKRAYRLLARKYHPDVSKHLKAEELFKSIRRAYEVLSNEVTRAQYDRILRFQGTGRSYSRSQFYSPDFEERERIIYRWVELRRKMRYSEQNDMNRESTSSYRDSDEPDEEESIDDDRGPFTEVLRSAFISLFLLQTFGSRLSLTFSGLMALFDQKLDTGYKIGYLIAWILGGRGGILLTLCLQFASWVCGKTSSSVVALVVVAFWVGSSLARYAPLPQGALLTLLYMSMKLQLDLN